MIHNIREFIANNYDRSLYKPDNYLSFDNPDYLVSNEGKLYGLFIPMQREKENVNHLLRRVYMSRLTYSPKMQVLLIGSEHIPTEFEQVIHSSFCKVLQSDDDERHLSLLLKEQLLNKRSELTCKVRKQASDMSCLTLNVRQDNEGKSKVHIWDNDQHILNCRVWGDCNKNQTVILNGNIESFGIIKQQSELSNNLRTSLMFLRYTLHNDCFQMDNSYHFGTLFYQLRSKMNDLRFMREKMRMSFYGVHLLNKYDDEEEQ